MRWREFLPARPTRNTPWFLRRRWLPGARKSKSCSIWTSSLRSFTKAETEQLSSILAGQTYQYMVAAWRVSGKTESHRGGIRRAKPSRSRDAGNAGLKFLAQPPKFYPFLKDWQAMIAAGGKEEDEAKALRRRLPETGPASGNRAKRDQGTERGYQSESRCEEALETRCAPQ